MESGFVALGHAGSEHYAGLETFPNPGVDLVTMESDELRAICPVTAQPDLYVARDRVPARCALHRVEVAQALPDAVPQRGPFRRGARRQDPEDVAAAIEVPVERVRVALVQKARGGIAITASVGSG